MKKKHFPKKIQFSSHKTSCRICLNTFSLQNQAVRIGDDVEKRFFDIFRVELSPSSNFSRRICSSCDRKMKEITTYVDKVKFLQEQLFKFVEKEINKEFEVPAEQENEKIETVKEEIFVKCEPEEVPSVFENFLHVDLDLDLQSVVKEESEIIVSSFGTDVIAEIDGSDNKGLKRSKKTDFSASTKKIAQTQKSEAKKFKTQEDLVKYIKANARPKLKEKVYSKNQTRYPPKKVQCELCGKVLYCKLHLEAHIATIHEKIKRFSCDMCPYRGCTKDHIYQHMKRHIDIESRRIHKCPQCDYVAPTTHQLQKHMPKHTGYQFKCTYDGCSKVFRTNFALNHHLKIHAGVRDRKCHLCEKAYYDNTALKNHLNVAHNQTTFCCDYCDYKHSRRDQMIKHYRSVHKLDEETRKKAMKKMRIIYRNV